MNIKRTQFLKQGAHKEITFVFIRILEYRQPFKKHLYYICGIQM